MDDEVRYLRIVGPCIQLLGSDVDHVGRVAGIVICLACVGGPDVQRGLRIAKGATEPVDHHFMVTVFVAQYGERVFAEEVGQPVIVHGFAEIVLHEPGKALGRALVVIGALPRLRHDDRAPEVRIRHGIVVARLRVVWIFRKENGLVNIEGDDRVSAIESSIAIAVEVLEIVLDRESAFAFPEGLFEGEGVIEEIAGVVVVVPAEVIAAKVEGLQIGEALIDPADAHDLAEIARVKALRGAAVVSSIIWVGSAGPVVRYFIEFRSGTSFDESSRNLVGVAESGSVVAIAAVPYEAVAPPPQRMLR